MTPRAVSVGERREELCAVGAVDVADVEPVPQDGEHGRRELLGDEHHGLVHRSVLGRVDGKAAGDPWARGRARRSLQSRQARHAGRRPRHCTDVLVQ
jgi:hypothetical protein